MKRMAITEIHKDEIGQIINVMLGYFDGKGRKLMEQLLPSYLFPKDISIGQEIFFSNKSPF